jgi:cysteine protease ATG4
VGIAGGRPSAAHYFCASQGDYLFYLDPHHPRPALPLHQDLESYTPAEIDSCHTRRLRRMHLKEMDPSMLIAFLVKDRDDWIDWLSRIDEVLGPQLPWNLFVQYTNTNNFSCRSERLFLR